MNPLSDLLARQMVFVFFLYGLVFFAMGVAIVVAGEPTSRLRFGRAVRLLAAFGLLHGVHEWIEMFQLIAAQTGQRSPMPAEEATRVAVLAASFVLLLAFALRLILPDGARLRSYLPWVGVAGGLWLASVILVVLIHRPSITDVLILADGLARYLLGIPAALLAAWALMKEQHAFREHGMARYGRDLVWCATALLMYGAVGQLFVRPAPLPPASVVNSSLFMEWFGIPVQLFRAAMATLLAIYVTRTLNVFAAENRRRLEDALASERGIAGEMERLNDTLRLRTRELSLLLDLTNLLAAPLSLQDGLRTALEKMIGSLTFPSAGLVSLLVHQESVLRVDAAVGFDESDPDSLYAPAVEQGRLSCESGLIVCRHSDNAVFEFSLEDVRRRQECRRHAAPATMISFPLIVRAETIGSITFSWSTPRHRTPLSVDEYEIMVGVAHQLAVAIENARLRQQAHERERLLGDLLRQVVSVQETERQRIARELHDVTGQSLTAIALGLRGVETTTRTNPELAVDQIHQLGAYSTAALMELRRLIADLRPSQLDDLGLVAALQWYLREFETRHSVKADLVFSGDRAQRLPAEHETVLFRVVQEALTNVAKHAHASQVTIRLEIAPDRLSLAINDDGRGFDAPRARPRGSHHAQGWGLLGIQERATLLGGQCEITSQPGQGTCIAVTIPLAAAAEAP